MGQRIRATAGLWLPLGLAFLALFLRLWRWDAQSLWLDEAMSWWWARLPWEETLSRGLQISGDPHPPLYYLALHLWLSVFGDGEGALKAFSIAAGTLLVLPVYGLGRRLFGPVVGAIAGLLVIVNPFLIWYSQEVRMYALLGLLTTSATYALWQALSPPNPSPRSACPSPSPQFWGEGEGVGWGRGAWSWFLYLLLTIAALYTHFYAALIVPVHVLFTLAYWRMHRRVLVPAFLTWAAAGLAYLPWAWRAWQVSGQSFSEVEATSLWDMVIALAQGWSLRVVPEQGLALALLLAPFIVLFLLGLVPRRGEQRGLVLLVLWLVVPLFEIAILSRRDPIFGVQYAIAFAPPFYLLVARGVDTLRRFGRPAQGWLSIGVAGLALLVAGAAVASSLYGLGQNANPIYRKEDWRSLAQYVREHEGPHDAVLCVVDYAHIPFEYYYRDGGRSPVFHPFGAAIASEAAIAPTLVGLEAYDTVWFVESHEQVVDPNHIVQGHLGRRWPVVTEQFPVGAQLRAYAVRYRPSALPPDAVSPCDAVFGGKLRLLGYRIDQSQLRPTDDVFHPPSNWIHVTLYWQALAPLDADYTPRLELSGNGIWGGNLERPTQMMRFYPSSQWAVGEIVRDEQDVNLNPVTPPGAYRLAVRVQGPDGAFLSLADGLDYLLLPGDIAILP
ncbi:MAG: glycosyltransferase family 39 protein [Chloroflexi bacterium]|nr:glycosyltransferase family 39 protein [Chloroflexota bacterium]MBU1750230.1 glycosyltransferase family 39 protein [Chloroflexota bacterium]